MIDKHEKFMNLAIEQAKAGMADGELPIGAVVVSGNEVISQAYCQDVKKGFLSHAEIQALQAADLLRPSFESRKNTVLYSTLEPCLMCMGAAMSFFVGTVVYALKAPADGAIELVSNHKWGHDSFDSYKVPEIIEGVLKDESEILFRDFIEKKKTGPLVKFAQGIIGH